MILYDTKTDTDFVRVIVIYRYLPNLTISGLKMNFDSARRSACLSAMSPVSHLTLSDRLFRHISLNISFRALTQIVSLLRNSRLIRHRLILDLNLPNRSLNWTGLFALTL